MTQEKRFFICTLKFDLHSSVLGSFIHDGNKTIKETSYNQNQVWFKYIYNKNFMQYDVFKIRINNYISKRIPFAKN